MAEMNQRQVAEDWLKYALENWRNDLKKMKIRNTGELLNSFRGSVLDSADNRLKLEIAFTWYGTMVDMGVGRGTKKEDVEDNVLVRRLLGKEGQGIRRPKPWFSRGRNAIGYQTNKLARLLGGLNANFAVEKIASSFYKNHKINLN